MDDGGCGRRTTAMLMIIVDLISRKSNYYVQLK